MTSGVLHPPEISGGCFIRVVGTYTWIFNKLKLLGLMFAVFRSFGYLVVTRPQSSLATQRLIHVDGMNNFRNSYFSK